MFINALMLTGLGAAVLPLVLHLLSRARHRSIDWGAMMFLRDDDARMRQSSRVSQWLLMAVRMALIVALALALARPVAPSDWSAANRGQAISCAIVLDASASTAYDENGQSRFDLIRTGALQVLAAMRPGDRASLIVLGAPDEPDMPATSDLRDVAARVSAMRPGLGRTDVAGGLTRALDSLEATGAARRDVYVVTDRQALSWRGVDESFFRAWRRRADRPDARARVFAIAVGDAAVDNLSIAAVEIANPPAVGGQPAEVEIRLRNAGPIRRAATPLSLSLDGKVVSETTIDIGPDETTTRRIPIVMQGAGSHLLSAAVKTSGLTVDDHLDAAVDVAPPIRVLVVSGDERPTPFRGESDFFRLALAPRATARALSATSRPTTVPATRPSDDAAVVDVVPADQWSHADLSTYSVLALFNIEQLDDAQVRAVEQFAYGGGGVLIAPGNLSRVVALNAALYRGGAGLMPAELSPPTPGDGSQATTLLGFEPTHPIFRFARGRPDPLPAAAIGRYFPAAVRQSDARVLASYSSGQPFLVESTNWGRGRVLLMTTPIDADWNTLPLTSFYLPFMQSMTRWLAGGTLEDRNLSPGQPIRYSFATPGEGRSARLFTPNDAAPRVLPILPVGEGEIRFTATRSPGVYRLELKEGERVSTVNHVVRASSDESNLAQLEEPTWQAIERGLPLRRIDVEKESIAAVIAKSRDGRELWPLLMGVVLALGLTEVILAGQWTRREA